MIHLAIVTGNGLTIDYCNATRIGRNPSNPFSWLFNVPDDTGILWQEAFPTLHRALAEAGEVHTFAAFEALLRVTSDVQGGNDSQVVLDAESRQFLAFAYSVLQHDVDAIGLDGWQWMSWIGRHASHIRGGISFNYDLLLESAFRRAGIRPSRLGVRAEEGGMFFLKPHGSIDFECDPRAISMPPSRYPLENWATLNNTPVIALEQSRLCRPRQEAFIVLPTEYSPYLNFQWVAPGYDVWRRTAHVLTHCVFVGISDWICDQAELDEIIAGLGAGTTVIVANPKPPQSFIDRVSSTGRHCIPWKSGPQDLLLNA